MRIVNVDQRIDKHLKMIASCHPVHALVPVFHALSDVLADGSDDRILRLLFFLVVIGVHGIVIAGQIVVTHGLLPEFFQFAVICRPFPLVGIQFDLPLGFQVGLLLQKLLVVGFSLPDTGGQKFYGFFEKLQVSFAKMVIHLKPVGFQLFEVLAGQKALSGIQILQILIKGLGGKSIVDHGRLVVITLTLLVDQLQQQLLHGSGRVARPALARDIKKSHQDRYHQKP